MHKHLQLNLSWLVSEGMREKAQRLPDQKTKYLVWRTEKSEWEFWS